MGCIINSAIALLKGQVGENVCVQSGAIAIAVVAFVLGIVVMCAICKLMKPCKCANKGAAKGQKAKKDDKKFEKRHPAPADGSIEIYAGNLSYEMTDELLRKEFEPFGTVNSARIVYNKYNNKSKGFGFVHMPNPAEVEAAVAALNDKEVLGRKMKCNVAKNVD